MDPNLLKRLGLLTCQAALDDDAGGGVSGGGDDGEPGNGASDDDEGGGPDGDPDDGDDGEGDEPDDDPEDGDDGEDEAEDAKLGERARKRIGKLVKERNAANAELARLKEELDGARKLAGDDGKAILAAARRSGILPGLMTKDEAQAFDALAQYPRVIERYQDWLDEHGPDDEFGDGDDAMSYGAVKKRVRRLSAELEDLKDGYGARQKELQQKVRQIFDLGMKAYRKGAKAGGEGGKPEDKGRKAKPKQAVRPRGTKPVAKGGRKSNWGAVDGDDSFVRMIASENEGEE